MSAELSAFAAECEALEATLAAVPGDAWGRPALGEWDVAELVAHLVRGADRLEVYAERDPGGDEPACDRVGYWRFDLAAQAPAIAERARARAAQTAPERLPEEFRRGWRASANRFVALDPEHLLYTPRGPMRAVEYLATRVLEMCVHHFDLRTALDVPPVPTREAATVTVGILEGLLGQPRPRGQGRTRFIREATGRLPADDPRYPLIR